MVWLWTVRIDRCRRSATWRSEATGDEPCDLVFALGEHPGVPGVVQQGVCPLPTVGELRGTPARTPREARGPLRWVSALPWARKFDG